MELLFVGGPSICLPGLPPVMGAIHSPAAGMAGRDAGGEVDVRREMQQAEWGPAGGFLLNAADRCYCSFPQPARRRMRTPKGSVLNGNACQTDARRIHTCLHHTQPATRRSTINHHRPLSPTLSSIFDIQATHATVSKTQRNTLPRASNPPDHHPALSTSHRQATSSLLTDLEICSNRRRRRRVGRCRRGTAAANRGRSHAVPV